MVTKKTIKFVALVANIFSGLFLFFLWGISMAAWNIGEISYVTPLICFMGWLNSAIQLGNRISEDVLD